MPDDLVTAAGFGDDEPGPGRTEGLRDPEPARRATGPRRGVPDDHDLARDFFDRLVSSRDLFDFVEQASLDGLCVIDVQDGGSMWVSDGFRDLFGYSADEAIGGGPFFGSIVHPEDLVRVRASFERQLADPSHRYDEVVRYRHRDGSTVWVRSRGVVLRDDEGRPERFVAVHTDLTEVMRAREALAESLDELAAVNAMLQQIDRVGQSLQLLSDTDEVLRSLVAVLGREVGDRAVLLIAEPQSGVLEPAAFDTVDDGFRDHLRRHGPIEHSPLDGDSLLARVHRSGTSEVIDDVDLEELLALTPAANRDLVATAPPTSMICVPWRPGDGSASGVVLVERSDRLRPGFVDRDRVLVEHLVERHLAAYRRTISLRDQERNARFRELAENAPMAILQIAADGGCVYANERWCELSDLPMHATLGQGWVEPFPQDELARLRNLWGVVKHDRETVLNVESRLLRADGTPVYVEGSALAQYGDDGEYAGVVIIMYDTTARKQAESELTRQARHDPLTGVANRYALFERLDEALRRLRSSDRVLGVLFIDLDELKRVNDTLGHEVGDQLLAAVARRLRGAVRALDVCARVGGDEFVIVCEELRDEAEAHDLARRVLEVIQRPFVLGSTTVAGSASVGVVSIGAGDDIDSDELLRRADLAMYHAKSTGRCRWEPYRTELDARSEEQAQLHRDLARALQHGGLVLHYQPVVDLHSFHVVGVEALVRFEHPIRGLLAPGEFLDIAESSGLIVPLGEWVAAEACRQLAVWRRRHPELRLALNLSGRELADARVVDRYLSAARAAGVPEGSVCVELTETTLIEASRPAVEALHRLRAAGMHLAVDDFGTGYSSLSRLKSIPADVLKLDRTFAATVNEDPADSAIVSAVVHLARRLDLQVVCEGIETAAQLTELVGLGCSQGQGYLFSRPVPAEQMWSLLEARAVVPALDLGATLPTGESRPGR